MSSTPLSRPLEAEEFPVESIQDAVVSCASKSLDALEARGHLKAHERAHIEEVHMEALEQGKASEVFETITRLSTVAPREIPDFISGLGLAVAKTLKHRVTMIPNVTRLATPVAFYNSFPELANTAKALLVPVLFSEDNEAIGVGSVNPIPAMELAGRIVAEMANHTIITPYMTVVRLDYDTWRTMIERHFGL